MRQSQLRHAPDQPDIPLVDQLDNILPQTQCGKCGHGGCRPYAEAMASGETHTKCPPGGEQTLVELAKVLRRAPGVLEQPAENPKLAVIREDECIGCTKCIQACPVDAIVGAAKQMHGILENECTGCELCVAPCPVDCIDMVDHPLWAEASNTDQQHQYLQVRADIGRYRFAVHNKRVEARKVALQNSRMERLQRRLHRQDNASPSQPSDKANVTEAKQISPHSRTGVSERSSTESASTTLSSRDAAQVARLKHKLSRLAEDAPQRAEIEKRLQALQSNTTDETSSYARQSKMALAACEQRRRMAERHLKHCERQCGPVEIKAAKEQLQLAQQMEEEARQALM